MPKRDRKMDVQDVKHYLDDRFATKEDLSRLERKVDDGFVEIRREFRETAHQMGIMFEEMKSQFQVVLEVLEPLSPVIAAHEARIQKLEEGMIVVNLAVSRRKN